MDIRITDDGTTVKLRAEENRAISVCIRMARKADEHLGIDTAVLLEELIKFDTNLRALAPKPTERQAPRPPKADGAK